MLLFLKVMLTEFIAEMGDKTQLMLVAMTSRYKIKDILHEKKKNNRRPYQAAPASGKTRYPLHRHDARYPLSGIRAAE